MSGTDDQLSCCYQSKIDFRSERCLFFLLQRHFYEPGDAGPFFLKRVHVATGKLGGDDSNSCPGVQFLPRPVDVAEIDALIKLMKKNEVTRQPIAYYFQDDSLSLCFFSSLFT